jgi:hypothetical protein
LPEVDVRPLEEEDLNSLQGPLYTFLELKTHNSESAMFDTSDITKLKGVLGWRQHFTPDIVVSEAQLLSSSGRYFQEIHPALSLDKIKVCLDKGQDINDYLTEVEESGIKQALTMIRSERLSEQSTKDILVNDTIYSKYGGLSDGIINEGYFVGYCVEMKQEIGLMARILSIGLHTVEASALKIYIFHSSQSESVGEIDVTSSARSVTWTNTDFRLFSEEEIQGGEYYIGYYQSDLSSKAINYEAFDWQKGPCEGCDNGVLKTKWRNLNLHLNGISSFYVAAPPAAGTLWEKESLLWVNNRTWGLNLKLSVECNLNRFIEEHSHLLDEVIGLSVAERVLGMMKYSMAINSFEENLKVMVVRDSEGDKETNMLNINQRLSKAVKAISFDMSKLSAPCLNCFGKKFGITKGQA